MSVCPYAWNTSSHTRHDKVIAGEMCVLIFSTILTEPFLILRRIQRVTVITVRMKFEFSEQILEKSSNIKFNENPPI